MCHNIDGFERGVHLSSYGGVVLGLKLAYLRLHRSELRVRSGRCGQSLLGLAHLRPACLDFGVMQRPLHTFPALWCHRHVQGRSRVPRGRRLLLPVICLVNGLAAPRPHSAQLPSHPLRLSPSALTLSPLLSVPCAALPRPPPLSASQCCRRREHCLVRRRHLARVSLDVTGGPTFDTAGPFNLVDLPVSTSVFQVLYLSTCTVRVPVRTSVLSTCRSTCLPRVHSCTAAY